jgi:hypothetical protein
MELAFQNGTLTRQAEAGLAISTPRGEGKTWFVLAAKAIAGKQISGWRVPNFARLLYVDGESGRLRKNG